MKRTLLLLFILVFTSATTFAQPNGYYDDAEGLDGYSLKTALSVIIDDVDDRNAQPFHIAQDYGDLWELYESSDTRMDAEGNIFVWEMYSDCDFQFDIDQDRGSGGRNECDKFNREHSFPRSWFDNNGLDIYSDPFHVIPSDKRVNSERGNLAYGEVASTSYTSSNGSKVGSSALEGPTGRVFEPADEFKGDIARQFFYVATRYQNLIDNWETNDTDGDSMLDGSNDKVFEDWALNMLFDWHTNDPVSDKERQRQEAIFNFQDNRNPFIDNPQWVEQIWSNVLANQNVSERSFTIFPNPVSGNILTISLAEQRRTTISIYSILGKKVMSGKIQAANSQIDISDLSTGVYIVQLKQGDFTQTLKLVRH